MLHDNLYKRNNDDLKVVKIVNLVICISFIYWQIVYIYKGFLLITIYQSFNLLACLYVIVKKDLSINMQKNIVISNLYCNLLVVGSLAVGFRSPSMYGLLAIPYIAFVFYKPKNAFIVSIITVITLIYYYLLSFFDESLYYQVTEDYITFYEKNIIFNLVAGFGAGTTLISKARESVDKEVELLRAEEQVSFKNQNHGVVGAQIAHEINNPLTIIKGFAKNLDRINKDYNFKPLLDEVGDIQEVSNLLKSIMDRSGNIEIALLDLKKLLDLSLGIFDKIFDDHSIKVKLNKGSNDHEIQINVDKNLYVRTLLIMLQNAYESTITTQERIIEINVFETKDSGVIEIINRGDGLKASEEVFEPFVTSKSNHLGLGLSLAIEQVQKIQCSISYEGGYPHCYRLIAPIEVNNEN